MQTAERLERTKLAASAVLIELAELHGSDLALESLRSLAPLPGDYARVFRAEVAESARAGYRALWSELEPWPLDAAHVMLRVSVATVEQLARGTGHARDFPAGYAGVAEALAPEHLWVSWEFLAEGDGAGLAFDGLVELDGRWAWFPKPWRILPPRAATLVSHWID